MKRIALASTVIALLIAGCGGESTEADQPAAAPTTPTAETTPTQEPAAAAPNESCLADEGIGESIIVGATGNRGKLVKAAGIAPEGFEDPAVRLVAVRFTTPDTPSGDVAVFATKGMAAGDGPVVSVEGYADQFFDWPLQQVAEPGEVQQARDCVK